MPKVGNEAQPKHEIIRSNWTQGDVFLSVELPGVLNTQDIIVEIEDDGSALELRVPDRFLLRVSNSL